MESLVVGHPWLYELKTSLWIGTMTMGLSEVKSLWFCCSLAWLYVHVTSAAVAAEDFDGQGKNGPINTRYAPSVSLKSWRFRCGHVRATRYCLIWGSVSVVISQTSAIRVSKVKCQ